jgi:Cu/Ag efflux pump CusA
MKFTDIFIRRPVLAIVVNLVIIIAGLQAIRTLNVRQYPKLESASVTVKTAYVGANADLVRGFITTPLERAPPLTASTTSSRRAPKGCRRSASASNSTSTPRRPSPTSARA